MVTGVATANFLDVDVDVDGPHAWLVGAAATGTVRLRAKRSRAVEFATIVGLARADQALAAGCCGRPVRRGRPRLAERPSGAV